MSQRLPYGLMQHSRTPGPEVTVEVSHPEVGAPSLEVTVVIDSGAVRSTFPIAGMARLEQDRRAIRRSVIVSGATGNECEKEAALLRVRLDNQDLGEHWLILLDREYGLIGRDILNWHRVLLDGPRRQWELDAKAPE